MPHPFSSAPDAGARTLPPGFEVFDGLGGESETQEARRRELHKVSDQLSRLYDAILDRELPDAQWEQYGRMIQDLETTRRFILGFFPEANLDTNLDTMVRAMRRQLGLYSTYLHKSEIGRKEKNNKKGCSKTGRS